MRKRLLVFVPEALVLCAAIAFGTLLDPGAIRLEAYGGAEPGCGHRLLLR
jgi:hypothetical protein